jgi:Tfp pilus assembly protein PilF
VTLLDRKDFEGALSVAERALELFPMSAMSHVLLARVFSATGDPDLARGLVEAALEIDPEHGEAIALAGTLDS